jgi:ADP-ribose pyrophosphatase
MIETVSSKRIYKGRTFDVRVDEVREDDLTYEREIVAHKGSAVIVPLFDDGSVALVRQYRHATGKHLLEVPAGSLDEGEDPLAGALRELEEEIGVTAASVEKLCEFYVSPGFVSEKMHLYLATGLTETQQNLDADERIDVVRMSLSDALDLVQDGTIEDAKTIIGLLLCRDRS